MADAATKIEDNIVDAEYTKVAGREPGPLARDDNDRVVETNRIYQVMRDCSLKALDDELQDVLDEIHRKDLLNSIDSYHDVIQKIRRGEVADDDIELEDLNDEAKDIVLHALNVLGNWASHYAFFSFLSLKAFRENRCEQQYSPIRLKIRSPIWRSRRFDIEMMS